MPGMGGNLFECLPTSKDQLTKSMKKYERDLKLKNRVLREKEKAIFNNGVLKKLCQNQISTSDLQSDRTLTNHRSKAQLLAMGSQASIALEASQLAYKEDNANDTLNRDLRRHEINDSVQSFKQEASLQEPSDNGASSEQKEEQ